MILKEMNIKTSTGFHIYNVDWYTTMWIQTITGIVTGKAEHENAIKQYIWCAKWDDEVADAIFIAENGSRFYQA